MDANQDGCFSILQIRFFGVATKMAKRERCTVDVSIPWGHFVGLFAGRSGGIEYVTVA